MNNWIKANKSLPNESGLYLTYVEWDEGKGVMTLHYNAEERKWCYDNHGDIGEPIYSMSWYLGVLNWQALPEPPNKAAEQKSNSVLSVISQATDKERLLEAFGKHLGYGTGPELPLSALEQGIKSFLASNRD